MESPLLSAPARREEQTNETHQQRRHRKRTKYRDQSIDWIQVERPKPNPAVSTSTQCWENKKNSRNRSHVPRPEKRDLDEKQKEQRDPQIICPGLIPDHSSRRFPSRHYPTLSRSRRFVCLGGRGTDGNLDLNPHNQQRRIRNEKQPFNADGKYHKTSREREEVREDLRVRRPVLDRVHKRKQGSGYC